MSENKSENNTQHFFTRLGKFAVIHGMSVCGDTFLNVTLAGSAFLSVDITQARYRVAMSLLITILPFALLAPYISKALAKVSKAQFYIIALGLLLRAVLFFAIAKIYSSSNLSNEGLILSLFLALSVMVISKTHYAVKNSCVALVVDESHDYVSANSRLTLIQAVAGGVGAGLASAIFALFDAKTTLIVGALIYLLTIFFMFKFSFVSNKVGKTNFDLQVEDIKPKTDISVSMTLKYFSNLLAITRFCIGSVMFLCVFKYRSETTSLAIIGGTAVVANFCCTILAPLLMKKYPPKFFVVLHIPFIIVSFFISVFFSGVTSAAIAVGAVAIGNALARNGFDAYVQSQESIDQSSFFTGIEGKLQAFWVCGALFGVLIPLPIRFSFFIMAIVISLVFILFRNNYLLRTKSTY